MKGSPRLHVREEREAVAAQWLAGARREEHYEQDCKTLWVTVLVQAIHDLVSPNEVLRSSARAWVESRDNDLSSFEWVCSLLGADPAAIRERLTDAGARRIESHLRIVRSRERPHGDA